MVAALTLSIALTSCGTSDAGLKAFVGQPSSELLARLGTPRLRVPSENGGQIWIYEEEPNPNQTGPMMPGSLNNPSAASPRSSALSAPVFGSKKEFFIDASGTIYKYQGKAR